MQAQAQFGKAQPASGMYESFYLRAVSPEEPLGVWLRYTIHKRPGHAPTGSLWCTVFDGVRGAPFMHKETFPHPSSPPGEWIEIGGSVLGPEGAEGRCGEASWKLRFAPQDNELRHLRPGWLYRAPLPRTKLTSPAPLAGFEGTVQIPGRASLELSAWPGMIGHNWGAEHAERWIWLHGCCFGGDAAAGSWVDLAAGRLAIAGRMTPWVINGALSHEGRRTRIGGLLAGRAHVHESATGCSISLRRRRSRASLELLAQIPEGTAAGWRYADPDGGEHDVVNCSIAALQLTVTDPGGRRTVLETRHGGTYELGMRERDHGVTLAPFGDG